MPPGYAATAAALALFAAVPVTIVPDPALQPCGTWPTTRDAVGLPRLNGMTFAAGAALAVPDAPLPALVELPIARPPIATARAAEPAAMNLVSLRENMETAPCIRCEYRASPLALNLPYHQARKFLRKRRTALDEKQRPASQLHVAGARGS